MNQEEISNLIPAHGKMIVKLIENKESREGGLIYIPCSDDPFNRGEVIKLHRYEDHDDHYDDYENYDDYVSFGQTSIEVGDTVLWGRNTGQPLSSERDAEMFFVVAVKEVIAISKIKNNKEEQ